METIKKEELKFDDSVKQNSKGQVILGRLYGPCADFINATRNGRKYDESLWEKVFNDPIVNEYFEAGGYPGELDHPTDRLETCSEKIAIMMPEKPKKDKDGHLIATFDILDTPNGRIAYTLAKYGYKLGISSRGGGDTYQDVDGEHVDEDTYDFHGFDLVLLPAVKAARLQLQESLQNGKTFKQAINESLEKATPDEKKIMTETLDNLNIEYISEKSIDKESELAANDDGATMVKELQETLLAKQQLEAKYTELQEKLSVCYAKEAKYEEDLQKYKSAVQNLSIQAKNAKALNTKIKNLEEELTNKDKLINLEKNKFSKLNEQYTKLISKEGLLNESLSKRDIRLKESNSKINNLKEELDRIKSENQNKVDSLNEDLADIKKNLTLKTNEYSKKLSDANNLVEQYRQTAKKAVNKYIESQAVRLGIDAEEIKSKLPKNYSFNDIDSICENLSQFNLAVSSLPVNLQKSKIKIKESKEPLLRENLDDKVDESLLRLANLD